jgi:subtilase family serine protease
MKSKIFIPFLVILVLTVMSLVGCVPPILLPDLVPANPTGMFGYCNVDDSNNLIVYVKNQGEADALASLVKVQFYLSSGLQEFSASVGPLLAGETKSVSFAIPLGCFNPDCNFIITVDSGEDITESSELNNTVVDGICIG